MNNILCKIRLHNWSYYDTGYLNIDRKKRLKRVCVFCYKSQVFLSEGWFYSELDDKDILREIKINRLLNETI